MLALTRLVGVLVVVTGFSGTASAIDIFLDALPPIGSTIATDTTDSIYVYVSLDTRETVGITLLSVAVHFDATRLSYNRPDSTTVAWLLYNEGMGEAYLYPSPTCDGQNESEGLGCAFWVTEPRPRGGVVSRRR